VRTITGGKFKQLKQNETIKRETKLQNYLRSITDKVVLNKTTNEHEIVEAKQLKRSTYENIVPCGSRSGIMYGLPKIHKQGAPLRPIISACGTYNYKLAKHLDQILKPLMTTENYIIKDTFDFVNKVSKLPISPNNYMTTKWME